MKREKGGGRGDGKEPGLTGRRAGVGGEQIKSRNLNFFKKTQDLALLAGKEVKKVVATFFFSGLCLTVPEARVAAAQRRAREGEFRVNPREFC